MAGVADADDRRDLGVVLVHGIGRHQKGQVLANWGDALVSWMQIHGSGDDFDATGSRAARVVSTRLHSDAEDPANADLEVVVGGTYRRWMLVESCWAASFVPPTFSELVSWSQWTFPATLLSHVAGRMHTDIDGGSSPSSTRVRWTAAAIIKAVPALVLAPVVVLCLLGMLLLGAMPIGSLRRLAGRAQQALAQTVGDSLVLLDRPMQSAAILDRVRRDIRWAGERCDNVVVLAHSQGAAIALDALQGVARVDTLATSAAWQLGDPGPRALITFGSGVNKLFGLRRMASAPGRGERPVRLWAGSVYLYGLALGGALVWRQILTGSTQWGTVLSTALGFATGIGVTLLLFYVAARVLDRSWVAAREWARGPFAFASLAAIVVTNTWIADLFDVHLLLYTAIASAVMVAAWIPATLRAIGWSDTIDLPPSVDAWIDIHASGDLVPGGSTMVHANQLRRCNALDYFNRPWEDHIFVDIDVINTASVLRDHSWYWKNSETFIPWIVMSLSVFSFDQAEPNRPDMYAFVPLDPRGDDARRNRVRWLIVGRAAVLLACASYVLWQWHRLDGYGRQLHEWSLALPLWLPWTDTLWATTADLTVTTMLGFAAVVVVVVVGYLFVVATWTLFDRQTQRASLAGPRRPWWSAVPFAITMAVVLASVPLGDATATWLTDITSPAVDVPEATILGQPVGWVWFGVATFGAGMGLLPWLNEPRSR